MLALSGAGACDARPKAAPQAAPKTVPQTAPQAAPKAALQVAPKAVSAPAPAASLPASFPDAAGPARLDRAAQAVVLTDGRKADLSSWRFEPAPGRSEARNTYWCGVQLDGQTLTVIGVGATEAVSCDGLAAAGAVSKGRIGLIYRTSSPNADSLTAVVLTPAGAAWTVDEDATERLEETSPATLTALRKAVD